MDLTALLEENRETLLGRWFGLIRESYPPVTSEFLARQKDPFRNPVGQAITRSIGPIYDQVVSAMDTDELLHALDDIVRIRAVQDFSPSEALAFVFQLKAVIRDVLDLQVQAPERWKELAELEARIDRVALLAFEKYTECREKLHEIRINELRSRTRRLLERAEGRAALLQQEGEPIDGEL